MIGLRTSLLTTIALVTLLFFVGLQVGFQIGAQAVREEHRRAVFQEQVARHQCRLHSSYRDGKLLEQDLCVFPDGKILHRSE